MDRKPFNLTATRQPGGDSRSGVFRFTLDQDEVLVGRGAGVDVLLPHPEVSLVHLRLLRGPRSLVAVDPGSTNGTWLDGKRLRAGRATRLVEGSRLSVGPFELVLSPAGGEAPTSSRDTAAFARAMVLEMLGAIEAGNRCTLEVTRGPERGARLDLDPLAGPFLVGRGEECHLRLSDADASRQHLEIRATAEGASVRDLESKNGSQVNGQHLDEPRKLAHGDEIQVGQTVLAFNHPVERYLGDLAAEPGEAGEGAGRLPPADPGEAAPPPEAGPGAARAGEVQGISASEAAWGRAAATPPAAGSLGAPDDRERGGGHLLLMTALGLLVVGAICALIYLLL